MSARFTSPIQFRVRGDPSLCYRMMDRARVFSGWLQNQIQTGPEGVTHRAGRTQVDLGDGITGEIAAIVMAGPQNTWTAFVDLMSYSTTALERSSAIGPPVPPNKIYYMDSGYLAIGVYNSNPVVETLVDRPVLYQGSKSTQLTNLLTSDSSLELLGPKDAVSNATPPSFDWLENTPQLWDKVASVYYIDAPSNFSGKLRLYAQARYGRTSSASWDFGIPSNTNGSLSGYGLYTDADYKYWLIYVDVNPTGTSVTITATLLATNLYELVFPIVSNSSSTAEQKIIAEAYALSRAYRTSTVLTKTITPPTPIVTFPLAYSWHWLWDGSEARIVAQYNNYGAGQNYISKYFSLSLDISDSTITASISLISQGTWAPGSSANVFFPLAGWEGSTCLAYGFNGANTVSAPLYCYVKSHGSVYSNDQEFVLVTCSFGVAYTQNESWLSSCHTPSSWENSYVSDTHGRISGYSITKKSISTSDGGYVEGNNYTAQKEVFRRENITLLRVDHGNSMPNVQIRNIGATPCGAPPEVVETVTNARYRDNYIYSFTTVRESYFSHVNDVPLLIIPIGNADSCVLGESHYEYISGGYTVTSQEMQYAQIKYTLWDGREILEGWKETSYWGPVTWNLAPDAWNISGTAVYKTSFGDASTTGSLTSWGESISFYNSTTGNVAMIVQGVTHAARCAGAGDSAIFINGFPLSVGTGKAAVIGFA